MLYTRSQLVTHFISYLVSFLTRCYCTLERLQQGVGIPLICIEEPNNSCDLLSHHNVKPNPPYLGGVALLSWEAARTPVPTL